MQTHTHRKKEKRLLLLLLFVWDDGGGSKEMNVGVVGEEEKMGKWVAASFTWFPGGGVAASGG